MTNFCTFDRYLPPHLPLYKVELIDEVLELKQDPRNVQLSEQELLEKCKIDLEDFTEEQGNNNNYEYEIKASEEKPFKERYRLVNPKLYDQLQKTAENYVINRSY